MKRSTKIAIIAVFVAVTAALGIKVYLRDVKNKALANEEKIQDEPTVVRVKAVSRGVIYEELVLTGSIAPNAEVKIVPEVTGKVVRYSKEKGAQVKKGELLVEIDRQDYEVALEQAQAALSVAKAQLEDVKTNLANTERELARIEALRKEGVVSQQFYDEVKTRRESFLAKEKVARAAIEQAQAQVSEATLKLNDTRIESPISGIIAERYVDVGDMATPSAPLYHIVDVGIVKVVVDVPERIMPLLQVGKAVAVEVDAYPSEQFGGKIRIISPTVVPATRTGPVEIAIANEAGRLRPGMFSRAHFIIGEHNGVVIVPRDSLVREGNVYFACVVTGGKAERRRVSPGVTFKNDVEILDGLSEGEVLVVEGQANLRSGANVKIVE
jgi:membrane fusion protein (multidrug efflux system)